MERLEWHRNLWRTSAGDKQMHWLRQGFAPQKAGQFVSDDGPHAVAKKRERQVQFRSQVDSQAFDEWIDVGEQIIAESLLASWQLYSAQFKVGRKKIRPLPKHGCTGSSIGETQKARSRE